MTHDHPPHDDRPQGEPSTVSGDRVGGDKIDARGSRGFINRALGPITQNFAVQMTLGTTVILAIALVLTFGVPGIAPTVVDLMPTATPEPTPTAFAVANDDESLIIVADFRDESEGQYTGSNPASFLYHSLTDRVQRDGLDVRVERLYDVLDANTVRQTGETYSATLVLWGEYNSSAIIPVLERIRLPDWRLNDEEGAFLMIADLERIQLDELTNISAMGSYITLYSLGVDQFVKGNRESAHAYLTSAINATLSGEQTDVVPDEAYYYRGLVQHDFGGPQAAIEDFTNALEAGFEDTALVYYHRGLVHRQSKDLQAAIEDFTNALEAGFEDTALVYYHRGLAYEYAGTSQAAIEDFTNALEAGFEDTALVYYHRGLAHYSSENYQKAVNDFRQAQDIIGDSNRGIHAESKYWLQEAEAKLNSET
jgi:hypothetical protein